jgi:hypothetical protein
MMDEKLRKESHDNIIFFLAEPENCDKEFVYGKLYDSLKLPSGHQRTVWQSLANWKTGYVESRNGILPNVKIWITPKGIEYATTEQAKNEKANKLQLIVEYKLKVLSVIKEFGIGKVDAWNNFSRKAGIPEKFSEDIKDILCTEGLIVITSAGQGTGGFVKGQPNITGYLLGLPKPSPSFLYAETLNHIIGDGNQIGTTSSSNSTIKNEGVIKDSTIIQSSDDIDFRPAVNPINQPISAQKNITAITIIVWLWEVCSKNPLISAIIAMVVGTLILKYYEVI